ncbi:MAG: DUF512 domain-containing protein [FCB group bacterium]|nr:DUF512 domain-containing protein [FCB group bacterium]
MMKVIAVDPDSPLFGYVRPGYMLKSVNGEDVVDIIDFRYKITEETVAIRFSNQQGKEIDFKFNNFYPSDLGLTFQDDKIRICENNCIFCFVHQQPKGLRRSLYVKDEDYRLSFTHGNFITLSNIKDEDIKRIVKQHLSPLYISVHTTDDKLRRCMLRNEKLAPIVPRIKELVDKGITIHTQVVLCPTINDGVHLEKTINQLVDLYPGVKTLAVVPVGLTKYREHLPQLRKYNKDESGAIIDYIEKRQKEFLHRWGSRFVWAADEFYVEADRPFPRYKDYEEMAQFENGIGMAREFIYRFNRSRYHLRKLRSKKRVLFLTGYSAYPFFERDILPYVKEEMHVNLSVSPIKNEFWGEMVTVSGLLTGKDLLRQARNMIDRYDTLVLPPNCLNDDNLFLDDMSWEQFRKELNKEVLVGQYHLGETLKEVCQ